ncbi:MAG: macrocin O-methyltransferase [Bacteroidetes bacterium]|jgi:predicted O-methyltransferase YrrM|nr:macrocin O-methyltransferase [Bacteroidota bacterium]
MKSLLKNILKNSGYEIKRRDATLSSEGIPVDMTEPEFREIFLKCREFSTCSVEPMYALFKSVEYVVKNNIAGDLVECGVYKGGSAMMMALSLLHFKDTSRKIYLYDTFEGMSEPTEKDVDFDGRDAKELLNKTQRDKDIIWCYGPLEEVKKNMLSTGYSSDKIIFTKGKVEDTIPGVIPSQISLLRLDTDWFESTHHELVHLYPLLKKGGVLIIDDYGHWQGARKAVDEYFNNAPDKILLNRIDYTVRAGIKL